MNDYSDNEIVILVATGMIIGIAFGVMIAIIIYPCPTISIVDNRYMPDLVHNDSKDAIGELVSLRICAYNGTYYMYYQGRRYKTTDGMCWTEDINWTKYAKLTNKSGSYYYGDESNE